MTGRVRVFIAMSVDGFIAGPNHEIDWLPEDEGMEDTFTPFMAQVGALLMGRRTYDVLAGMENVEQVYGDAPILVSTTRPLTAIWPTVRAIKGTIETMLAEAKEVADGKDVYVDGGNLIRQALDAGLVDEMTITVIPVVLGQGISLFAGTHERHRLDLVSARPMPLGLVELVYRPGGD